MNSENYIKLFNRGILRDCKRLYPDNDFIFIEMGQHRIQVTEYFKDAAAASLNGWMNGCHKVRTVFRWIIANGIQ